MASLETSTDSYALFRQAHFLRYWIGNTSANFGMAMLTTAIGWDLYDRTHSALALGWVGLVQFVPVVLLALLAGHAVDVFDRRRIVLVSFGLLVLCSAGFAANAALSGPLAVYYVLLFLMGTAQAFYSPARSALLPGIVPMDALPSAINWTTSGSQLAYMAGPAIAGLLIAQTHAATTVYVVSAVLSFVFVLMLLGVPSPPPRPRSAPSWGDVIAGLHFVWREPLMLAAITLDMFAVLLGGAVALLPVFAKDIFHAGPTGLGWLTAAPYVGSFLLGLVVSHRPPIRRNGPVLLWMVAGFGLATIGFALSPNLYWGFVALAATGAFDMVSMLIRQHLVQQMTPDAMRGRVSAVTGVFIGTSNELGGFESGLTAHLWGPVRAVLYGGIGTMIIVSLVAWRWPVLRRLGAIENAEA
ncbi:MAG TPA: MFS transporter [Oscillatoriaceae cyanobacterium]